MQPKQEINNMVPSVIVFYSFCSHFLPSSFLSLKESVCPSPRLYHFLAVYLLLSIYLLEYFCSQKTFLILNLVLLTSSVRM